MTFHAKQYAHSHTVIQPKWRRRRRRAKQLPRPRPRAINPSCGWELNRELGSRLVIPNATAMANSTTDWAKAHSTITQHTTPTINGPRYFSPSLVGTIDSAEKDEDHIIDTTSAGKVTAMCPTTNVMNVPCLDQIKAPIADTNVHRGHGRPQQRWRQCLPTCALVSARVTGCGA